MNLRIPFRFRLNVRMATGFVIVFVILTMSFTYEKEVKQHVLDLKLNVEDHLLQMMQGPVDPLDPNLVSYIRNKMLNPPSFESYNLKSDETGNDAKAYMEFKTIAISYLYITPIIQHLFMNTTSGFFIEAGAMDGEFLSNTLSLEKDNGWTGLLVEPDAGLYQDLLEKNRKSWSINACLSTKPYPFRTYLLKFDKGLKTGIYYSGSNSLLESRDVETRRNDHYSSYEEVQCVPLQTILKALNITKVDFFSLDVEDVEEQVLDTIPFTEIEIVSLAVEHRSKHHKLGTLDQVIDKTFISWFNEKGYSLYTFTRDSPHNYFFIKNGSQLYSEAFSKRPTKWDPEFIFKNSTFFIFK